MNDPFGGAEPSFFPPVVTPAPALRLLPARRHRPVNQPGWHTLHGDLGEDPVAVLIMQVRAALFAQGLAERSVYVYLRSLLVAEEWCRQRDSSVTTISDELVAELIETLPSHSRRRQMSSALRHLWRIRDEPAKPAASFTSSLDRPGWSILRRDLGGDEVGQVLHLVRAALLGQGLAPSTVAGHLGCLVGVDERLQLRGRSLLAMTEEDLAECLAASTDPMRTKLTAALRHFWELSGRDLAPFAALPAPTRRAGRRGWRTASGPAAERLQLLEHQLEKDGLSPCTIDHYLRSSWQAERWCQARGLDLPGLDSEGMRALVDDLGTSHSCRRAMRSALVKYFEALGRRDAPVWLIRCGRKPIGVCRALDEDQAAVLAAFARAEGGRKGAVALVGLHQAMRRAEIASMKWVDFRDGWVHLIGKGGLPAQLPVHPHVTEALAKLPHVGPFVFPSRYGAGGHISVTTINNWVTQLAAAAGVAKVTTHRLRHTALATANDRTGNLRAVQEFARHARPETTALYTRTTPRRLVEVMESIDYDAATAEA